MKAQNRIKAERSRQITEERYTPEHDDRYHPVLSQLEKAARAYHMATLNELYLSRPPMIWPFEHEYWKPSKDKARNLQKAGALFMAAREQCLRKADELGMQAENIENILQQFLDEQGE
jgi:hypothetical protein